LLSLACEFYTGDPLNTPVFSVIICGKCWEFDFSPTPLADKLAAIADDVEYWRRSPLRLFENDKLLGPAHVLHLRIRASGNGSYSHWQNRLLFSTSDNTNPNTNGRVYSFDLKG